jgi:hypothetical protein
VLVASWPSCANGVHFIARLSNTSANFYLVAKNVGETVSNNAEDKAIFPASFQWNSAHIPKCELSERSEQNDGGLFGKSKVAFRKERLRNVQRPLTSR